MQHFQVGFYHAKCQLKLRMVNKALMLNLEKQENKSTTNLCSVTGLIYDTTSFELKINPWHPKPQAM